MVFAWDAVPVYLDPSVGKILVPYSSLDELKKKAIKRRARLTGKCLTDEDVLSSPG